MQRAVAEQGDSKPERVHEGSLAFMLESCFTPRVTHTMLNSPLLDADYYQCWQGLRSHFTGP
ncbi:unnamed protein product, partial [Closterium sp. NIES-54]